MHALTAAQLLDVWEQGRGRSLAERALLLLAAACPEVGGAPAESLARLPIGRRDADLLTLREQTFGPRLASLADCPGCGGRLEAAFTVADIRAVGVAPAADPAEDLALRIGDCEVRFRLPNSLDLLALAGLADRDAARRRLFERCLLEAQCRQEPVTAGELSDTVVDAVAARMGEADPQADVQLAHCCPGCGRQWLATLDIVSFFWSEIDAWACRALGEVHTLASAYGWSEAAVLALSPARRQVYLELVGR